MLEEGSGLSTEQTIDTGLPLIGSAIKMEWFREAGEKERAAPPEFTLVLSPDFFVHCVVFLCGHCDQSSGTFASRQR